LLKLFERAGAFVAEGGRFSFRLGGLFISLFGWRWLFG